MASFFNQFFFGLLMDSMSLKHNIVLMRNHFFWVIEGLLAGSPGPDEIEWDLTWLWDSGIRAILSLNAGDVDAEAIKLKGFRHLMSILPDNIPPGEEDYLEFKKHLPQQLDFIDDCVKKGQPVLVHCHAGMDRTGIITSSYLAFKLDKLPHDALSQVRKCNPYAVSSEGFEAMYHRLVSTLKAEGKVL